MHIRWHRNFIIMIICILNEKFLLSLKTTINHLTRREREENELNVVHSFHIDVTWITIRLWKCRISCGEKQSSLLKIQIDLNKSRLQIFSHYKISFFVSIVLKIMKRGLYTNVYMTVVNVTIFTNKVEKI